MYVLNNPLNTVPFLTLIKCSLWWRCFLFGVVALALGSFALSPTARAVLLPPPDGGYPNQNTAEGEDALFSLTTGDHNSANGYRSLQVKTHEGINTANGKLVYYS